MSEEMNEVEVVDEASMTPQEYFDIIKDRKSKVTDEQLVAVYENCLELIEKYKITNQKKGMAKLIFHIECIEKERQLVKMGIDTFVYRDDIEYYIDNVAANTVKIIELENYEREIPDEIVDTISMVKGVFDALYVVFTDYTGKAERQVEKERRSKDPILFGVFQNPSAGVVIDRFYYLGDWIDEYCDLTLDKMVNQTENVGGRKIAHSIKTPEDIKELKGQLSTLIPKNEIFVISANNNITSRQTFFDKVKTFWKRKNEG